MAGLMYFATEERGQWVPCPQVNMSASRISWGAVSKGLNGGSYGSRSYTGAKQFDMSWGLKSRDELRPVQDYADGFYGQGEVYFMNPFAMDKNVLPAQWASGYLNAIDGPLVRSYPSTWPPTAYDPNNDALRPTLVSTGVPTNGFPTYGGGTTGNHTLFIPVPPGYTFKMSVHHTVASANSGVWAIAQQRGNTFVSTNTELPTALLTAPVLTGYSIDITTPDTGILLEVGRNGLVNTVYTGMMAQIVKTGTPVNTGQPFVSGQGHSGLQFLAPGVEYYEYSYALDKVQASASLAEVGSWL